MSERVEDVVEDYAEAYDNDGYFEEWEDYFDEIEDYVDEIEEEIMDDPAFKIGKAIGITGTIVCGMVILFMTTLFYVAYPKRWGRCIFPTIAMMCFILALSSGLLFVGLGHEMYCKDRNEDQGSCRPSGVGYCAAVAFVLFTAGGTSILIMKESGALEPQGSTVVSDRATPSGDENDEELG